MNGFDAFISAANAILWHDFVLYALLASGILFTVWSGFCQYHALTHGVAVTRGVYDKPTDPGAKEPHIFLTSSPSLIVKTDRSAQRLHLPLLKRNVKLNMLNFFMDIHQLKVFSSVFKNRSFSRASEELHLTQPTSSDHIKTLEEELECKLFDRLGRTIIPTKEAEALYSHAIEIIEKTNITKDIIGRFKKDVSGELIVGASTIPGTYLMPSLMAAFQIKHPGISFQIFIADSKEIGEKVSKHELLIGVVGTKVSNGHINHFPFIEDELIAVS